MYDYQTENIKLKIIDDILYVKYTPNNETKKIDHVFAREAVLDRLKFTKGQKFRMLVDAREFGEVTQKAMKYWSTDEAIQDVKAGAILTDKTVTFMAAKLYLTLELLYKKPEFPANMFLSEKKAITWLNKHQ
jgi:hypothetical protein